MPALPSCLDPHACPPLPPAASLPAPGGQRPERGCGSAGQQNVLCSAAASTGGPSCSSAAEKREGAGKPRTEVQPGWSEISPQIRGARPSDSVDLGPGVQLWLIADWKPQKSLPGARTVFTDIFTPETHLQLWGRAPRCRVSPHCCPKFPPGACLAHHSLSPFFALLLPYGLPSANNVPLLCLSAPKSSPPGAFLSASGAVYGHGLPQSPPQSSEPSHRVPEQCKAPQRVAGGHRAEWDLTQ